MQLIRIASPASLVVPRVVEVPRRPATGDLQKVADELRAQCLGAAFHLGVPVQPLGVRGRVSALAGEEVEQLDEVPLQGVGAALAALEVVLAELPVEQPGVRNGEVALDSLGCHPHVQVLAREDVGLDRPVLVRTPVCPGCWWCGRNWVRTSGHPLVRRVLYR
jgi:hypothetical protein